jgi:hypothetical protein
MLLQQDPFLYPRPDAKATMATRLGFRFDSRGRRPRCFSSEGTQPQIHRSNSDENLLMSAWVKALADHILKRDEEEIPPGWLTTKQIGKLLKRHPTTTSRLVSQMVRDGRAEMRKFKGTICAQRKKHNESLRCGPRQKYLRKTPYFRLISPPIKPPASKSYKQ